MAADSAQPRTYQLVIRIGRKIRVQAGRLGEFEFPAGRYVYTGSARRGLDARIRRHLSRDKRLHWHIDYLLAAPAAKITRVVLSDQPECALNRVTQGAIVAPGFGSSDCSSGCGSHLKLVAPQGAVPPRPLARGRSLREKGRARKFVRG